MKYDDGNVLKTKGPFEIEGVHIIFAT
jgi:hypothetical protein